jgi:hypothetical protein
MPDHRTLAYVLAVVALGCTSYKAVPFSGDGAAGGAGGSPISSDGGDAVAHDGSGDRATGDGGGTDSGGGDGGGTDAAGTDAGRCTSGTSCTSGFCNLTTGQCVTTQCQDGAKNGSETDVDCGGSCAKCARDQACGVDGDCKTGSCVRFYCALVSGPPNWLPGPSLNTGRGLGSLGVEPLPGRQMLLVAIGGRTDTDPTVSTSYEILDTTTTPLAWSSQGSTLPNGMIGYGEPTVTDSLGRVLTFSIDGMWSYTGNSLWQTSTSAIPNPRDQAGAAIAPNGIAYLVGGSLQPFNAGTSIIEGYDAKANTWKTGLAAMPTPRTGLACAAGGDGRIYALGGQVSGSNGTITTVGTAEAYNPTTNTWASLSELPDPAWLPAAVGGPDGRVYTIGGLNSAPLSTVNAYSAVTNRWSAVAPLDIARAGVAAAVAPDGHIWAAGGTTNFELDGFKTVLIYGPSVTVAPAAAAAGAMASVSGSNFAANATVSVYFGSTTTAPVGTGTTNASGTLAAAISFRVPNLAAGEQALIVMDDRSQYPITLSFRAQ